MANIIEVRNSISSIGILDASVNISQALQLPQTRPPIKMMVTSLTLSDRIPNVFNTAGVANYTFNNTLLRAMTDVDAWTTITLPAGLYPTATTIGTAINSALGVLGWWTNNLDPGVNIKTNTITDVVTVEIDSTKLAVAHGTVLTLDFRKASTGTDLATTLGFSEGTALMAGTGDYYSNQEVKLDTQGTTADVQSSLVTSRRRNGDFVKTLALVTFAGKTTSSDNIWPSSGQISPKIVYEGDRTIKSVQVSIKTMNGDPMIFLSGSLHLVVAFMY